MMSWATPNHCTMYTVHFLYTHTYMTDSLLLNTAIANYVQPCNLCTLSECCGTFGVGIFSIKLPRLQQGHVIRTDSTVNTDVSDIPNHGVCTV